MKNLKNSKSDKVLIYTRYAVVMLLLLYLTFSFIKSDICFINWGEIARTAMMLIWFISICMFAIIVVINHKTTKFESNSQQTFFPQ